MNVYKDKVVVITGAGGVLCSMMAKEYAKLGAKVAVLDLNLAAAQKVADEIVAEGGVAKAYAVNCLEKESMEKAKSSINAELGHTDILINGAGGNNPKGTTSHDYFSEADMKDPDVKSFFDLDGNGVDFVFKLNFLATFLTTQVFAKDMVGRGGNIINVSSMNAFRPLTRIPAYSGAKASVSNFTEWLAVHFAKEGIRVNAIAPGFFVTKQNYGLLFDENGAPTERSKKILASTPMGRFGEPEEILGTLTWLTDDTKAGFVTGIVVPIDGGFSAYSGV
ncbi:MAG TPA: SDR family oxidoreductase [Candidatus Ornithoclostridium excrementipullorum]|nr:SDR family oxidoreductase [Candidatus Ornithoclostridium excrementipullorum]